MNKHGIRLISFILALFSFIMIFQNIMNDQQQLPLGTTEQLVLNIAETGTTKEQLISELDNITNKHNATRRIPCNINHRTSHIKDTVHAGNQCDSVNRKSD